MHSILPPPRVCTISAEVGRAVESSTAPAMAAALVVNHSPEDRLIRRSCGLPGYENTEADSCCQSGPPSTSDTDPNIHCSTSFHDTSWRPRREPDRPRLRD